MLVGMKNKGPFRLLFDALMSFADGGRRLVMNTLFLFLLLFLGLSLVSGLIQGLSEKGIEPNSALVLRLSGDLIEQSSRQPQDMIKEQISGESRSEIELGSVLKVIEAAAEDERIDRVILMLDELGSAGLASLREVGAALDYLKKQGKEVIAYGTFFDQKRYLLAAYANEVYIDPLGGVMFTGFGRYRQYYKEAFDRLGVKFHVIQTGDYKNFAENFTAKAPSKATQESDRYLFEDLWQTYLTTVEQARGLEAGSLEKNIEAFLERAREHDFDMALMAQELGWVQGLASAEEFRELMIERGAEFIDPETKIRTYRHVFYQDYLAQIEALPELKGVAVIVAEGGIADGAGGPGVIGGDTTSQEIRRARFSDKVEAIVLRVNSPGGSAFASELIRRELEEAREMGKPVVVSMGDVAASGGYWISTSSDAIIADPATITGSIGVVGMFADAHEAMKKLSLYTHGSSTTWIGEAFPDPTRPMDPRAFEFLEGSIQKTYQDFLELVSDVREMEVEQVKQHAQGRVWTGTQALERGLVDALGGLDLAVQKARELAKLEESAPAFYWKPQRSKWEVMLEQLMSRVSVFIPSLSLPFLEGTVWSQVQSIQKMVQEQSSPEAWFQGKAGMAHCFCDEVSL